MTPHEAEIAIRHNFWNISSFTKDNLNWWLVESLAANWDMKDMVF